MNSTREQLNYGVVRLADGTISEALYNYPNSAFCAAFCDEHEHALTGDEVICAVPLAVTGRTYAERKENLSSLAVEIMADIQEFASLSMGELADISEFFERQGRRCGLLREFRENCVC